MRLSPPLDVVYESGEHLDAHIKHMATLMVEAAEETLPVVQPRRKVRMKDNVLQSSLCPKSRSLEGVDRRRQAVQGRSCCWQKNKLRREVRRRVHYCAAMTERRVQRLREMIMTAVGLGYQGNKDHDVPNSVLVGGYFQIQTRCLEAGHLTSRDFLSPIEVHLGCLSWRTKWRRWQQSYMQMKRGY